MKNRIKQIVIWGMVVACIICSVNIQTTTVDASTTKSFNQQIIFKIKDESEIQAKG